jgi:hypothetical protein
VGVQFKETRKEQLVNLESKLIDLSRKLEDLIMQFNLYFSGELRVPPDMDREALAASIRNLQNTHPANASGSFLMQNLNARFALYNNMWLKKMHDIEVGHPLPPKAPTQPPKRTEGPKPTPQTTHTFDVGNPDSIQAVYAQYHELMTRNNQKAISDKALATALANRMKEAHVEKASVSLSFENGKLKIRLRK